MKRLIIFALIFSSSSLFSLVKRSHFVEFASFEFPAEVQSKADYFTNQLADELSKKRYHVVNPDETDTDFILAGNMQIIQNRYVFFLEAAERNGTNIWNDTVYTADIWKLNGIKAAAQAAADRMVRKIEGLRNLDYYEKIDYLSKYRDTSGTNAPGKPVSIQTMNIITIPMRYPYGYQFQFPLAFGLEMVEYSFIWMHPDIPVGIGIGSELVNIRGTNALSILPLKVYLPLYITPDPHPYNRRDVYMIGEWGFLLPQYSYYDFSIKLSMNGLNFCAGWLYLPAYELNRTSYNLFDLIQVLIASGNPAMSFSRNEYQTFYAGLSFSFGSTSIEWKE